MAITPFHYIPKQKFLVRMIRPAIFAMFLGYVVMGFVSEEQSVSLPPLQMAQYQYIKFGHSLTHIPTYCSSGDYANDFQKSQCNQFWTDLLLRAFWVAMPFLFALFFMRFMLTNLNNLYRRASKNLETGTGLVVGVVTDPPEVPNDFFGWSHYLRSITVQLPNAKQKRVYVPYAAEIPAPGSRFGVVAVNPKAKKENIRLVAAPYIPHVAVISGDRE